MVGFVTLVVVGRYVPPVLTFGGYVLRRCTLPRLHTFIYRLRILLTWFCDYVTFPTRCGYYLAFGYCRIHYIRFERYLIWFCDSLLFQTVPTLCLPAPSPTTRFIPPDSPQRHGPHLSHCPGSTSRLPITYPRTCPRLYSTDYPPTAVIYTP